MIKIEIAYALPERYYLKSFELEDGTSVEAAILQSGVLQQYPEINLKENKVGIFSRPAKLTDILSDGERIEIYRPLLADPKEIRRLRAEQQAKEAEEKKKAEKADKMAEKLAEREAERQTEKQTQRQAPKSTLSKEAQND